MAGITQTHNTDYVSNPAPGTVFVVAAGEQTGAEFDFTSDSPEVSTYELETDGLPDPHWIGGQIDDSKRMAAAFGTGTLRLTLAPPPNAAPGDYRFHVRIVSDGALVGVDNLWLILRVEPYQGPPLETLPPESGADSASTIAGAVIASPETAAAALTADSAAADRVAAEKASQDGAAAERAMAERAAAEKAVESAAAETVTFAEVTTAKPAAGRTPVERTGADSPAAKPRSTGGSPIDQADVKSARAEDIAGARSKPAPAETVFWDAPVAQKEDADHSGDADSEQPESSRPIEEPSILNPVDGAVIPLRPGETMLLRFSFTNAGNQEQTYVLDLDSSLDPTWTTRVQHQVNLTANCSGEVSMRLTPPVNAYTGEYPFSVSVGLLGGVLTPISLTLIVLATSAVSLRARETMIKAGPLSGPLDFALTVESAGNTDTAFRMAVQQPRAGDSAGKSAAGTDVCYETSHWRYFFDMEMEDLRSDGAELKPRPVSLRLRLQRKGIWWLGVRESHRVRVAAAPVTDSSNGGKSGNILDLTAVRWRLLPFPTFLLIPLFFLGVFFLAGGAKDFTVVSDGQYLDPDGHHWIVNPVGPEKHFTLSWRASPWSMLRLTGLNGSERVLSRITRGKGREAVSTTLDQADYRVDLDYIISRLAGGADREASVRLIRTRNDAHLAVYNGSSGHAQLSNHLILKIPSHGHTVLLLKNTAREVSRIDWWMARDLDESPSYRFAWIKNSGSLQPQQEEKFVIEQRDSGHPGPDRLVLVTTDAQLPVLTVDLLPAG